MTATPEIDQAVHDLIARAEFSMRHTIITSDPFAALSTNERHILLLVAEGETNSMIAAKMNLSTGTVRNYVSNILKELNVSNRAQAAAYAVQFHLEDHLKG